MRDKEVFLVEKNSLDCNTKKRKIPFSGEKKTLHNEREMTMKLKSGIQISICRNIKRVQMLCNGFLVQSLNRVKWLLLEILIGGWPRTKLYSIFK